MEISVGGYSFPCFIFLFFERIPLLCVLAEWRRYMGRFLLQSFVSRHKITPKVHFKLWGLFCMACFVFSNGLTYLARMVRLSAYNG